MVSTQAPRDHGTLKEKTGPALFQFSSAFSTFYMQGLPNIYSILIWSIKSQRQKIPIFRSARQYKCLSPSLFTAPFHRLQAVICFPNRKFLGFSSLFCMEAISTLITPASVPFPPMIHSFWDFEQRSWSQTAHSTRIKHLHGSLNVVSGCIYTDILIQIRSVAWIHISRLSH